MRPDPQRPDGPNVVRIGGENSTVPAWYVAAINDNGDWESVTCRVLLEDDERQAIADGAETRANALRRRGPLVDRHRTGGPMRPVPIPDELMATRPPHERRIVISAPDGDLTNDTISAVEAIYDPNDGTRSVMIHLDPDDQKAIADGAGIWLAFWGAMPVWAIGTTHQPL